PLRKEKPMRVLAIFAFSFAGAVLAANYWLPESILILLGLLMALSGGLACVILKDRRRLRKAAALICGGLALGLLWTAAYTALFFQPARALDDRTVRLTATVSDWPQETDYGYSVLVRAETDSFARLNTILYTDEQGAALRPGDRIAGVVHCTLGDRTFAGEEITYYTAKGIFLRGELYGRLEVQRPDHVPVRYWPVLLARAIKGGIDASFPPDAAPLVRALVTGNRDNLTDEFTTSLQRTGLSHTVAVSGMHLAFLTGLLGLMLGRGKRSTALACVVWVVLFCGVAGSTPSVLRAAVMLLMLEIAPLLDRERDSFTALAFALFLLLLWNPFSAAHVGLQLSFAAVAGIASSLRSQ
ncbi:MAG: ComEC/Rec2 family competence protein, partial [Clostridia bacterium]|nr:ComEC/Rec2 family competence protein [Clostridia bacterium]